MVNKLMIDSGFYIIVDIVVEENMNIFNLTLGPSYKQDDLENISITDDGKFLRYFENGIQKTIRDLSTTKSFEDTVKSYIEILLRKFPKNSILRKVDGEFVNYFDEE